MPEARTFSWRIVLALVMVPVLVAGGFLWGTYNSSDRLRQVEAAIVNLDDGVTLDGRFVPLGRQLSADLVDTSKEQNFSWVLADESHAWPGLASGRFAAVVVIPENFSVAATSYGNDDPQTAQQATLQVHTSPVAGVADGWLGNVLANAASRSLNATLTEAYLDRIYIGFNDTGKQFQTVADAAGKLADGTEDLSDGLRSASEGAGALSDGMARLANGSPALVDGVRQVQTGAGALAAGLSTMKTRTSALPGQGRQLASGVKSYVKGAEELADRLVAAGRGSATLAAGLSQLSGGLTQYERAMGAAAEDPAVLGVECPYDGRELCDAYFAGIGTGTAAAARGVSQLSTGLSAVARQLNEAQPSDAEARAQAEQLAGFRKGGSALTQGAAQLGTGLGELRTGIVQVADGATRLAAGLPSLTAGVQQYTGGVVAAAKGAEQLAKGLGTASDGSAALADGSRKLAAGLVKGAREVPNFSKADRKNLTRVVASPVDTSDIDGVVTPTLAWVSLLIALALWLGALATFAVIRPLDGRLALSTAPTSRLIGRALLPGVVVAAAQAIVLTGIGTSVLGLALPQAATMAGLLVLAGSAFVLVNHALAAWLGNAGRLISIAFAVLTTVSAVTSAVPTLVDSLRPLSPVSPALDGLRAVITGSSGVAGAVFALLGWLVLGLAASGMAVLRRRSVRLAELEALA